MVDVAERARLRTALAQLIDGAMWTDDFTYIYSEMRNSADVGVAEIGLFGWGLYSDDWNRRLIGDNALDPDTRRIAERCLQFLETDLEFLWPRMVDHSFRSALTQLLAALAGAIGILLGLMALVNAAGIAAGSGRGMDAAVLALVGMSFIAFGSGIIWAGYRFDRRQRERELEEYKRAGDWQVWPFLKSADYHGSPRLMTAIVLIAADRR
jgi:hypothetical protein